MPAVSWTEVIPAVGLAIGLAACAGLRAWLPLLLTGALVRADVIAVGSSFSFIASNRALILFGLASVFEIMADKVPLKDYNIIREAYETFALPKNRLAILERKESR